MCILYTFTYEISITLNKTYPSKVKNNKNDK